MIFTFSFDDTPRIDIFTLKELYFYVIADQKQIDSAAVSNTKISKKVYRIVRLLLVSLASTTKFVFGLMPAKVKMLITFIVFNIICC